MRLDAPVIASAGDLQRERVAFRVPEATFANRFLILISDIKRKDALQAGAVEGYWFEGDSEVKAGDRIVLYSKAGQRRERVEEDGSTLHFFYWQKTMPVWTGTRRAALFFLDTWSSSKNENVPEDEGY